LDFQIQGKKVDGLALSEREDQTNAKEGSSPAKKGGSSMSGGVCDGRRDLDLIISLGGRRRGEVCREG